MNKRGLSGVIVTLITVLLAIVAIGLVWVVISNIIGSYTDKIEVGVNAITLKVMDAEIEGSDLKIRIKRELGDGDISKVKVLLYNNDGESNAFEEDFSILVSETKTLTLAIGSTGISRMELFPVIVNEEGEEFVGTSSAEYEGGANLVSDDGLVGYYNFDNGIGDLEDNNDVEIMEDLERGKVASFNGGNNLNKDGEIMGSNNAGTVCAWVRPTSSTVQGYPFSASGTNYHMRFTTAQKFNAKKGSASTTDMAANINEWSHVCMTWESTKVNGYIKGEFVNSKTTSSIVDLPNFYIGSSFTGMIDDFRIYKRTLSETEIAQLYAA